MIAKNFDSNFDNNLKPDRSPKSNFQLKLGYLSNKVALWLDVCWSVRLYIQQSYSPNFWKSHQMFWCLKKDSTERIHSRIEAQLNGTNYQIMIVGAFYPVLASIKPILGHRFHAVGRTVWRNGLTKRCGGTAELNTHQLGKEINSGFRKKASTHRCLIIRG